MAKLAARKKRNTEAEHIITDVLASDPRRIEEEAGPLGQAFISAVDAAVHLQTGTIRAYVNWLRRQNPDASPQEVHDMMAAHFRNTASGTGASAGAAAAIPGIGLVTGSAAIAAESVLFLDLAAFYTVASAYLRGVDITDPEYRRAVVLTTLMGTQGVAIVETLLGDGGQVKNPSRMLAGFSAPGLKEANSILTRVALRSTRKKMRRAWLGKLLPLGIGAMAGTTANRKLAKVVVTNVNDALGPVPAAFAEELPAPSSDGGEDAEAKFSANPKEFGAWILRTFGRLPGKNSPRNGTKDAKAEADAGVADEADKTLRKARKKGRRHRER